MHIFFDLDDTVLCFEEEERVAITKTMTHFGIEPSDENIALYHEVNAALWAKIGENGVDRAYIRVQRFHELKERLNMDFDPVEIAEYYENSLADGYAFMPMMPEVLEALSKNHNIYLATNGITHIQKSRTRNAGIDKYFTQKFISEEIGYEKPKAEFFEYAMSRIPDFDRRKAIMIGDNLKADIKGANGVGIASCWINPKGLPNLTDVTPTYEIRSYAELFPIIEAISKEK